MVVKFKEKETAIELRRQGYSYSEILKKIPVAKSTLSLWLRSVGLAERQKQRLTEKKRKGQLKGAQMKRRQRILLTEKSRMKP
jgi:transposase